MRSRFAHNAARSVDEITARRPPRSTSNFRAVGAEDLLDLELEERGDGEGQRQAGVVLAGLDRVDRLARHAEALRQIALRPAVLAAELANAIVHRPSP